MANEEMALLAELTEMPDFGDSSLTRTQDVMQALGIGLTARRCRRSRCRCPSACAAPAVRCYSDARAWVVWLFLLPVPGI